MLEETVVPAGYVKKEGPYFFNVDDEGNITLDTSSEHSLISPQSGTNYTVQNPPGTELPKAGSIGTTIFYILGTMLVIGSGIFLISCRGSKNRRQP